jgi:hypothetical protein
VIDTDPACDVEDARGNILLPVVDDVRWRSDASKINQIKITHHLGGAVLQYKAAFGTEVLYY